MISDCLGSIFRTAGHKPAGRRRQRRDQPLVKTQCESGNARHCFTLLVELRPAVIAANAWPISLVNAPKSISAADLRGLKTTSTGFSRRALLGNDSEETFTAGDVAAGARGSSGAYSRNPGFTETRFRLLARRRESTARPPCVRMRTRNPCVLERRRRLG